MLKKNKKTRQCKTKKSVITRFLPNAILCALFPFLSFSVQALEYAEFDARFLRGNTAKETIDIQRFSYSNPVPAGEYLVDLYLNNQFKGRVNVHFVQNEANQASLLCADETLISALDLMPAALDLSRHRENKKTCPAFEQVVPQASVDFDLSTLRLDIGVAQALIQQRPEGYISPTQWQESVPVAFVRYDASHYDYRYPNVHLEQTYLGIDAGINIGGWAFRHRGSQSWLQQQRSSYETISTYAQHEVASLRGQFTIGDFNTSGQLLESFAVRGVQLESDDRMLASSVRGYAPIIRGVANSNALVIIRQNGNLLKEISVPAGPFVIDDLYPTGYGGNIEVEITESTGEKRTFLVPYTSTAQLIRQGYSRYQLTAGRYRYANELFDDKVAQATWQYGLTNDITLNLGGLFNKNYHAELVGVAFNTPIGAVATNMTWSNATFVNGNQKRKGYSFYASYNTRVERTQTNVTLAAYRYFSRDYYSLQDVLRANRSTGVDADVIDLGIYANRLKNQFQLSINQALPKKWGYVYLVGSTGTYWGSKKHHNQYQIGYSNNYKQLSYSLSYSQAKSEMGREDKRLYVNFSMPLGNGMNYPSVSQTLNIYRGKGVTSQTSLSGTLGKEQRYSYNLTLAKQEERKNISVSHSYYGSLGRVSASLSKDNRHNRQWAVSVSGAAVLHSKGLTLANDLGDTFAIIHAKGATGAVINSTIGNQLDYFGNGIVPYIEPYSINYVGINTDNLPDTVELSATEQQVIPKANSAILVNFASTVGKVVFFDLNAVAGQSLPPMGTDVFDEKGNNVGMVAQGGRIYTRGVPNNGRLQMKWGNKHCSVEYQLPKQTDDNDVQPLIIPVQCQQ